MKSIILAKDKFELMDIINEKIKIHGNQCDLNHIDVSQIVDMSNLFSSLPLYKFNGNISGWNVSKIEDMYGVFKGSQFNGDISQWDVSNVLYMDQMFCQSKFNQDISKWKPLSIEKSQDMFKYCKAPVPWWYSENTEEIRFKLKEKEVQELSSLLPDKNNNNKKAKI